ncbi:hypothetical protein V8C86DRAFT_1167651 [Haematococcus lacustris]
MRSFKVHCNRLTAQRLRPPQSQMHRDSSGQPSSAEAGWNTGDAVDVRGHGRATIVDGPMLMGEDLRYKVRYMEDDSCFWVTPARLRRLLPARKQVVVAFLTEDYRQAAVHNAEAGDVCLEIGCHAGITTRMLAKRCRWVLGVDTSQHVVDVARARHPHVQFERMDGNDVHAANALGYAWQGQQAQEQGPQQAGGAASPFTKVFIDISGQAPLSSLLPLLGRWLAVLPPSATIIIKNRALYRYMTTYETAKQQEGAAPDTDAHDTPSSAAMLSGRGDETSSDDGNQRSGSASTAELAALLMSVRDRCERFRCCLSYKKEAQHTVNHVDPVDLVSDGGKAERLAAKRLRRMARKQDAQAASHSNLTISVGCDELTPCEM